MQRFFFGLLLFCFICPTGVLADLYQWTDSAGVIHIVDESVKVPLEFRDLVKVHRVTKPSSTRLPLFPSRSFAENTQ